MSEVKSAKRILELLNYFARTRAPASLTQISTALGFPKSSCLSLLETLESEGYAYATHNGYYLTRRWLNESLLVAEYDQVVAQVRPVLEALQGELQETLILAQLAGDQVLYLDAIEADRIVRFAAHAGQTKPLHASASGRALLSTLKQDEQRDLLETLPRHIYTDDTATDVDQLLDRIDQGHQRGWHVNLAEHQADTLSVAVPVVLHGTAFALVVGAPMSRAAPQADQIGRALARAARALASSTAAAAPTQRAKARPRKQTKPAHS